jgi:hypothetical protein
MSLSWTAIHQQTMTATYYWERVTLKAFRIPTVAALVRHFSKRPFNLIYTATVLCIILYYFDQVFSQFGALQDLFGLTYHKRKAAGEAGAPTALL